MAVKEVCELVEGKVGGKPEDPLRGGQQVFGERRDVWAHSCSSVTKLQVCWTCICAGPEWLDLR